MRYDFPMIASFETEDNYIIRCYKQHDVPLNVAKDHARKEFLVRDILGAESMHELKLIMCRMVRGQ